MPRGAVLVNAARGVLVDVPALVEPPDAAPEARNLIVTPHAAWYSAAALDRVWDGALAALRAALSSAA